MLERFFFTNRFYHSPVTGIAPGSADIRLNFPERGTRELSPRSLPNVHKSIKKITC